MSPSYSFAWFGLRLFTRVDEHRHFEKRLSSGALCFSQLVRLPSKSGRVRRFPPENSTPTRHAVTNACWGSLLWGPLCPQQLHASLYESASGAPFSSDVEQIKHRRRTTATWINNVTVGKVSLTVQANMDFNALCVRPSLHIPIASLSSDEQQIGHRRRKTTSRTHYVEANQVHFAMEAIVEVTMLQVSPSLHTSTASFTGPSTGD